MGELAIKGGAPVRTIPWPAWPVFDARDEQAVTEVLRSGQWGGHPYPGPKTRNFLERFAEMQGGGYPVAVANGTLSLEVALRAAGIGWGDEVIVPAYTFAATATGPMMAGAIPVIADIDPATFCIDPGAVEAAITPRTRAIIPVHVGQQMADMDAITAIAAQHGLIVVEDAAHAHGARWRERGAGTIGDFGSFSLQSTKVLTAGEGGVLLCRTREMAERATSIIDCGRPRDSAGEQYIFGANYRMSEIHAALAGVGIERFPEQAQQREEAAAYLDEGLSEIPGVRVLRRDPRHTRRAYYLYMFAIEPEVFGVGHEAVGAALEAEGIPAAAGWPPMHRYPMFQPQLSRLPVPSAFPERFDFARMHFPAAERVAGSEALWLSEAVLRAEREGVDDVLTAIRKVWEHRTELG